MVQYILLTLITGSDIGNLSIGKLAIPPISAHKKVFFLTENGTLLAYK